MIVACGEAIVDLLPETQGEELIYRPVLGGSLYNVAVGIAQLGGASGFLWELSSDELGQKLLKNLKDVGVDTSGVRIGERPTVAAVVDLTGDEPTYAIADPGGVMLDTTPPDIPAGTTCLHVGSAVLAREPVAGHIASVAGRAPLVSIDYNVRPPSVADWDQYRERLLGLSRIATVVKASTADLATLKVGDPHAYMMARLEEGAALAILTAAAEGAYAYTAAGEAFAGTRATELVDTVGAGDAFMCGALTHLQRVHGMERGAIAALGEAALQDMLDFGQRAAAVVCGRRGAVMPTAADLEAA